ncbi:MAG: hypothetical protein ACRDBQ_14970 [Shewanella sp.]
MKVRLLNDGGYGDMEQVIFPVEVEACRFDAGKLDLYFVKGEKLIAIGASTSCDDPYVPDEEYAFSSKGESIECEVI